MLANAVRRVADVLVASFVLIFASPLLLAVALSVRIRLGSPVLFRQQRLGLAGAPFELLKFRTMRHATAEQSGPEFDAHRLTALGRFLRRTSLDELASMWNLLRGDITLVGPRPLPTHYWHRFRRHEYERFLVPPGITGLAQVNGRNTVDWDARLQLDTDYVRTRSLRGDLRIIRATIPMVITGSGVERTAGVTMHALPEDRP